MGARRLAGIAATVEKGEQQERGQGKPGCGTRNEAGAKGEIHALVTALAAESFGRFHFACL
jgi:hypothetical protein